MLIFLTIITMKKYSLLIKEVGHCIYCLLYTFESLDSKESHRIPSNLGNEWFFELVNVASL